MQTGVRTARRVGGQAPSPSGIRPGGHAQSAREQQRGEQDLVPKDANDAETHQDKRRIYNPVQKDAATFLETSEETSGARSLIKVEVASDGGTSPPYHKTYAKHFEVIEGSLEVLGGYETRVLRAGQMAVVPKRRLHRFHNTTDETVAFLCAMRPGRPALEKTIKIGYGPARIGLARPDGTPKNLYRGALLLDWSEIRVSGVFTLIELLMRFLAKRARRKGIDRKLEARYCQEPRARPTYRDTPHIKEVQA